MVFEKVKEILCDQLDLEDDEVTLESDLIEDLDADSLDLFDLMGNLEEEFGLEIPEVDLDDVITVGDIVDYIEQYV